MRKMDELRQKYGVESKTTIDGNNSGTNTSVRKMDELRQKYGREAKSTTQTPATATRTQTNPMDSSHRTRSGSFANTNVPTPASTAKQHYEAHRAGLIPEDANARKQNLKEVIEETDSRKSIIPDKLKRAMELLAPVDVNYARVVEPTDDVKRQAYKQRYGVTDSELNAEITRAKYDELTDDQKRRAINATTQTGWTAEQISGKRLLKNDGYTDEEISDFGRIAREEKYSSLRDLPDFAENSGSKIDMGNDATYQHMTDEERSTYNYLKNTGRDDEASDYYWYIKPEVDKRTSDEVKAEAKELLTGVDENGKPKIPTAGKIAIGAALTGYSAVASIPGAVESFLASAEDIASGRNPNGNDSRHQTKWRANTAHDLVSEMIGEAAPNARIGNVNIAQAGYDVLYSTLQSVLGAGAAGNAYTIIMGMGAAAEEAEKLAEQGVDRTRIVENALAKGVAEAFFEKFSVENLVKSKSISSWSKFLTESLKQAGIEASEEVFTEITNQITDRIIMGEDGEYAQSVGNYMSQGMSQEEAEAQAGRDIVSQVLLSGIEGFLSGGLAGAGMNAMQMNVNAKTGSQMRQNLSDEEIVNAYKDTAQEGSVTAEYAQEYADRLSKNKPLTNMQVGAIANQSAAEMAEEVRSAPKLDVQKRNNVITDVSNRATRLNTLLGNNKVEAVDGEVTDTTTSDNATSKIARISDVADGGTVVLENGNEADLNNIEFSTRSQENLYRGTVQLASELGLSTEDANAIVQAYNTTTDVTPAQYLLAAKESIVKGMYGIDRDITVDATYTDRFTQAQKDYFTSIGEKMQTLGETRVTQIDEQEYNRISQKLQDLKLIDKGHLGKVTFNGQIFDKKNYADYDAVMQRMSTRQKATVRQAQFLTKFYKGLNINFIESKQAENGRFYFVDENGVERTLDENGHYSGGKSQIFVDLNSGRAGEGMSSYTLAHELVHYVRDWSKTAFDSLGNEVVKLANGTKINDKYTVNDLVEAKMRSENISYPRAFEEVVAQSFESMLADKDQKVIRMLAELNNADAKTFNFIRKFIANMGSKISAAYNAIKEDSMSIEGKYIASLNEDYERLQKLFAEAVHTAGTAQNKALRNMEAEARQEFAKARQENIRNAEKGKSVKISSGAELAENGISDADISVDQLESGALLTYKDVIKNQPRTDNTPLLKQVFTINASGKSAKLYTEDGKVKKVSVRELRDKVWRDYMRNDSSFQKMMKEKGITSKKDIEKEIDRRIKAVDKLFDAASKFFYDAAKEEKYKFVGLQEVENQDLIVSYDSSGNPVSIVLSGMVNNGEYEVNFDFTKVCEKRRALQGMVDQITKSAAAASNGNQEVRVNLTEENIFAINKELSAAGVDTACLLCFVEARRYRIQNYYQEMVIDTWNNAVREEAKKHGINESDVEYFGLSSRNIDDEKGKLSSEEIAQAEQYLQKWTSVKPEYAAKNKKKVEAYAAQLKEQGYSKSKIDDATGGMQTEFLIADYVKEAADAFFSGETSGSAKEFKLLHLADLVTEDGRTRLHRDHPQMEELIGARIGTGAPKSVEAYTPYNGEIELLKGGTGEKTGDLRKYLFSIGGIRSQSFSDYLGAHFFDVLQKTCAMAARGFPAHTYTKEIYRAILFGMCGEKINLSAVYEIKDDVSSWDAGMRYDENGNLEYSTSDYKAKKDGKAEWNQSVNMKRATELQNDPLYSKNCGIIGVGHSWNHVMKMQADPDVRMIIGYHKSSLPVEIAALSRLSKSADYTNVQSTLGFNGFKQNLYNTPEGVPSYATPPSDNKEFDEKGNARKKSFTTSASFESDEYADRDALIAKYNSKCIEINPRYNSLSAAKKLQVETEAAVQTLGELLEYANNNNLSLVNKKASEDYAKGHEIGGKKTTDVFHLYEDLEKTQDPYLTAQHYIRACIKNGLLPEFYEFTHKFENGKLVYDWNYYKNLYDFNVIDRAAPTITEDGRFYNADGTVAYAPQERVDVFNENGELLLGDEKWFEELEGNLEDSNRREKKAAETAPQIIERIKDRVDSNGKPLIETIKKQTRNSPTEYAPTFYSQMGKVVDNINQDKLSVNGLINMLKGKGVKDEEIQWSGIEEWLADKGKSVTKEELKDFIQNSMLNIETVTLNERANFRVNREGDETFTVLTPDGERIGFYYDDDAEAFLSPDIDESFNSPEDAEEYFNDPYVQMDNDIEGVYKTKWHEYKTKGGENYREVLFRIPGSDYSNQAMDVHWGRPGVLAHARIQDMPDSDGNKMLFIDEIQSDWHNAAERKENGVAVGYMKKGDRNRNTIIKDYADALDDFMADERIEGLMAGILRKHPLQKEMYAERLLSRDSFGYTVEHLLNNGIDISDSDIEVIKEYIQKREELMDEFDKSPTIYSTTPDAPFKNGKYVDYVLKNLLRMAAEQGYDKLAWTPSEMQSERWSDQFAEGYRIEYDQDIPKFLNKFGKKFGAKVGTSTINGDTPVWSIDITPEMRDSVLYEGQPLYQKRDTRTQAEKDADTIKDLRELLKAQGKVVEFSSKSLQSIANSLIGYSGAKETTDVNKVANELGKFYRWVVNTGIDTGTTDDEKTYAKIYAKTEKIAQALGVPQSDDLAREVIESMFAAERLKTVGTQHAEKIAELKAKHKNELFDEKLASDIYYGRKIKELREQRDRKLAEQRQHTSEQKAKERESRNMRQIKERIYKKYNDLAKRLTSPSEKRYVPADLVNTVASVLDGLNLMQNDTFMSGERAGETIKSKARANEKLALLKTKYDALQKDETYKAIYDPVVADMLQSVIDNIGDTPVEEMTLAQMQDVYTLLNTLDHTIREAVNVTLDGKKVDAFETGKAMMSETNSVRRAQEGAFAKYLNTQLRADTMFNRLSGYTPDSTWGKMARRLNEGQNTMTRIIVEGSAAFQDLVSATKELARLGDYKHELVDLGLAGPGGRDMPITRGMMLSLYMHLLNEDNAKHVLGGGLTIPNIPAYYKGDNEKAWGAEARRAITADVITLRNKIESQLTDYERQWIKRAQWFFDEYSRDILNEATMRAYGFKKAGVNNYFPIHTDKNYRAAAFETIARNMSLENAGFMKERVHASNPILLEDLTEVIFDQLNKTAQYAGIMPAVKDFNKVYNTILPGYTSSLQKVINNKFGAAGNRYIENLLADLQGARKSEKSELMGLNLDRARGHMAQAVLSLNLRVAASQAASYPTAAAEIGWKPLAKALAHGGKGNKPISKADRELIAKYSPLLEWRLKGNSTTELGNIKETRKGSEGWILQKTKGLMGWISGVDGATVGRLWYAAQYYVDDNYDLEKGTDEYYKKVAEVFNNVVEKTQPNYTTMQRPDVLRSTNQLVKAMTMFMTQRLQNFNIVYDSAAQYAKQSKDLKAGVNGVTEEDVKNSQTQLIRAVSSQVVAGVTLVGMKAVTDAILHNMKRYKDDDDDVTWWSILKTLGSDFLEAEASAVLWGSELYDLISSMITKERYYGISVQGIDALGDVMTDVHNITTGFTRKKAVKLATDLCTFFGIPATQAKKYVDAITGWYEDITDGGGIYSNVE